MYILNIKSLSYINMYKLHSHMRDLQAGLLYTEDCVYQSQLNGLNIENILQPLFCSPSFRNPKLLYVGEREGGNKQLWGVFHEENLGKNLS